MIGQNRWLRLPAPACDLLSRTAELSALGAEGWTGSRGSFARADEIIE
jgi:hypothetical protein